jgi:hypothetical protein
LKNPFEIKPNPLQTLYKTNTEQFGHNPRVDLCPKSLKNIKKIEGILEKLGFGWVGDKMGILGIWVAGGGWVRWRMADGGVLVVGEAVGGGGCGWIWI